MFKQIISCGAVVYKKDAIGTSILLIKQTGNSPNWGIPKGHMERNENYMATACREVKEETGVDIKIVTRLPHVILVKNTYKKIVIPYLAIQTCSSTPHCDNVASEVVDVQWFNINSLPPIYAYQRPIIDAACLILRGYADE